MLNISYNRSTISPVLLMVNPIVGQRRPAMSAYKYRVIIAGDRNWKDEKRINEAFKIVAQIYPPESTLIVHGDCKGADRMAGDAASKLEYQIRRHPAEWSCYGKKAGPIRNERMITDMKAEGGVSLILIFHDKIESSKGTKSLINIAIRYGLCDCIRGPP